MTKPLSVQMMDLKADCAVLKDTLFKRVDYLEKSLSHLAGNLDTELKRSIEFRGHLNKVMEGLKVEKTPLRLLISMSDDRIDKIHEIIKSVKVI